MKVHLLENTWDFSNNPSQLELIVDTIEEFAREKSLYIQRIVVDSEEVLDDFSEYLAVHIEHIEVIEIEAVSNKRFLDELIITSSDYLKHSLPGLTILSNDLYKGLNEETWIALNDFIEGLQYISRTLSALSSSQRLYDSFTDPTGTLIELNSALQHLMEASLQKDNTLMADLLSYEIKPLLEGLLDLLNHTLDSEVQRNDLQ
jgi:hypothetical protein